MEKICICIDCICACSRQYRWNGKPEGRGGSQKNHSLCKDYAGWKKCYKKDFENEGRSNKETDSEGENGIIKKEDKIQFIQ